MFIVTNQMWNQEKANLKIVEKLYSVFIHLASPTPRSAVVLKMEAPTPSVRPWSLVAEGADKISFANYCVSLF